MREDENTNKQFSGASQDVKVVRVTKKVSWEEDNVSANPEIQ